MLTSKFVRNACAILLAVIAIGFAEISSAQQPSRSAIAISKEILDIKGARSIFDPVVRGVVEQVKRTILQTNFALQKDINDVSVQVHREFDSRVSEILDQVARIYASKFTEPELKELLAFYKSPLGRKSVTEEPKAIEESMAFGSTWADKLGEEVLARFRAEMKKKGHDI
jgi:uncharacterized protein